MSFYVRPMQLEDVRQVAEIDREAFPTMMPSANFQRELQNRLAHYIVACDTDKTLPAPVVKPAPGNTSTAWQKVLGKIRHFFNHDRFFSTPPPNGREYVVGFVGLWMLVDEAHITSIAARESYKRRGIGELLLISVTEMATELKAHLITLEVRVSNTIAQNLYQKYGFTKVGLRRGYYSDNFEDGALMSTPDLASSQFQAQFQQLREQHFKKWGMPTYKVLRPPPVKTPVTRN